MHVYDIVFRYLRKNIILAGLWFARSKPTMTTFVRPVMDQLSTLSSTGMPNDISVITCFVLFTCTCNYAGITIKTPCGEMTSKARLLLCSVDLPARASMLNMKLYNGKHACAYCEFEGVPRASSHMHRNWPYETSSQRRTHDSFIRNAMEATRKKDAVSVYVQCVCDCTQVCVCVCGLSYALFVYVQCVCDCTQVCMCLWFKLCLVCVGYGHKRGKCTLYSTLL